MSAPAELLHFCLVIIGAVLFAHGVGLVVSARRRWPGMPHWSFGYLVAACGLSLFLLGYRVLAS